MLTDSELKRLKELTDKRKKIGKLEDKEFAEFKELQKKAKDDRPKVGGPGNDFSWWNKVAELTRDCANFKSNYVAGREIDPVKVPYIVPGVLAIELLTCYKAGAAPTDPINVWARNEYLKMFQKYRPASGYGASDLGIAELAGLEVVKTIATYERIYGVVNRYSLLNVNVPAVEAQALGISSSTLAYLQGHLSDFRYDLNYLIRKAQRVCVLKDISLVADAISLLGYEYVDHDNPRGALILFTQGNVGIYNDTAISSGGSIQFEGMYDIGLFDFTADNMCKVLDTVLNALLTSDSIQRIYADLVVWFGAEAMLEFKPVPEDYIITPVYSESILHKMHNLEMMPGPMDSGTNQFISDDTELTSWAHSALSTADRAIVLNGKYHVYQVGDDIISVGVVKDANTGTPTSCSFSGINGQVLCGTDDVYGMGDAHIIDGYDTDPQPAFIVEGSLLKYNSQPVSTSNHKAEIITSNVNWLVRVVQLRAFNVLKSIYTMADGMGSLYDSAAQLAIVDWCPLTYGLTTDGMGEKIMEINGDVDVIIPASAGNLEKIQRTCLLSGLSSDLPVKA